MSLRRRSRAATRRRPTTPPAGVPATFGLMGSALGGAMNQTTANVPVPPNVVAGSAVVVVLYIESGAQTVTPPVGFAEAPNSPATTTGHPGAGNHALHIYEHIATEVEAGTYNFTITAETNSWRAGIALRIDNGPTTGSIFDDCDSAAKSPVTDGSIPAVSVTTTGADRLLLWISGNFSGGTNTPPTGFLERSDVGSSGYTVATLAQAAPGSSGSLTGTNSDPGATTAWVGAILPGTEAVYFGNKILIPSNVRIRGSNIALDFGNTGGYDEWAAVWIMWNWDGWLQPQIADAASIGNAIRFWGNTDCIASGAISQSTYLSQWRQALDYAVGTLGLYVYPTFGDFGHWGNFNHDQSVALAAVWGDMIAEYAPNIIGVDISNEAWASWFTSGGETGTHLYSTADIVTLAQDLCNTVRSHAHVPVTLSASASGGMDWTWRPTTPPERAVITQFYAMSDFLDVHFYWPSTAADIEACLATPEAVGKNLIHGEFGCTLDDAKDLAFENRSVTRAAWFQMVRDVSISNARQDGVFVWTCWDVQFNADDAASTGVFDSDTRTVRSDIATVFATFPTTR